MSMMIWSVGGDGGNGGNGGDGTSGSNGVDGLPGVDGGTGFNGVDGTDGSSGADGTARSPDTVTPTLPGFGPSIDLGTIPDHAALGAVFGLLAGPGHQSEQTWLQGPTGADFWIL